MSALVEQLALLHQEFHALKQEGVDRLAISDEALSHLQRLSHRALANEAVNEASSDPVKETSRQTVHPIQESVEVPPRQEQKLVAKEKPAEDWPVLPPVVLPETSAPQQWQWLKEQLHSAEVYRQHLPEGKPLVMGAGALDAKVLFCGEAPGPEEEVQLEPFVGPPGQLQTKIIQAMGLSREQVFLTNALYWRPDTSSGLGNRAPSEKEIALARPFLQAQLDIVQPKVIVALGATAAHSILGYDKQRKLGQVRGRWLEVQGIPVMTSYHPSYLIRNNSNKTKRMVWEDMMLVMEHLQMPISDKQRSFFS